MMDFDERVSVGSNMYLPSCTYYVSGPDFSSIPSFLPQTPSSRPMTYSYSSNLPQVQPVREVTFRDYAIDASNKWHHRSNLSHCYSAEEIMHRDCLPSPTTSMGEMFVKNGSAVYHSSSNATSSFYSSVGRNGVLPQAFDQFFETAYGNSENPPADYSGDKSSNKLPAAAAMLCSETCRETEEKQRGEESSSPESSSGNNEEKSSSSSTYKDSAPQSNTVLDTRVPCDYGPSCFHPERDPPNAFPAGSAGEQRTHSEYMPFNAEQQSEPEYAQNKVLKGQPPDRKYPGSAYPWMMNNCNDHSSVNEQYRDSATMHSSRYGYGYNGMDLSTGRSTSNHFGAGESAPSYASSATTASAETRYNQPATASHSPPPDPLPCSTVASSPVSEPRRAVKNSIASPTTSSSTPNSSSSSTHLCRDGLGKSSGTEDDTPASSGQTSSQNGQNASESSQPQIYPWMRKLHTSHEYSQNNYVTRRSPEYYEHPRDPGFQHHEALYQRPNYTEAPYDCNNIHSSEQEGLSQRGHVQSQPVLQNHIARQNPNDEAVAMTTECSLREKHLSAQKGAKEAIVYPWMRKVHVKTVFCQYCDFVDIQNYVNSVNCRITDDSGMVQCIQRCPPRVLLTRQKYDKGVYYAQQST
ncbi:Homeobox protein Hox-A11b [Acipenser ruthenus]|uniref:Homeobox protein Hox-A11b n=1 Tax=Acipenser ruthenus TaxID=7906 RepID=A0A444TXF9_ACIRT|nr:Homeobox protein Hox-A11b [Acipenser ruthenus]